MAVWYSLWSFVIFFPNLECWDQEKSGHLLYFSRFGMFGEIKIWQPWFGVTRARFLQQNCVPEFAKLAHFFARYENLGRALQVREDSFVSRTSPRLRPVLKALS
jgi:hypothetical protein